MMTREEKITFIVNAIKEIEGVNVLEIDAEYFNKYSDEELTKEVEWFDYLLGK